MFKQIQHVAGREDWTNQTYRTISNRVFKRIQHVGWQDWTKLDPSRPTVPNRASNRLNMLGKKIESIKLIQQYPTGFSNGSNILDDVWRGDWTTQTYPTVSNRVFKWIQHFGCLKRRLNQSNSSNNIQQGFQTDPTFWMMFEEGIELIKLTQQYPTGCSNGSNILDVWREDWTNQTHPTISNRVFKRIQHFGWCLKRILNKSDSSNNIQQGVQTDPAFWMMFEENIEQIRLIQQYPTGCSNGSNILDDVWREDWTNQTHPTISNRVFKRMQHFVWCLKRRLN